MKYVGKDFSLLNEGDDLKDGWRASYEYLKEPRSFRACLEQVNQEAFEAFHMSHENMGAIELYTKSIPGIILSQRFNLKYNRFYSFRSHERSS